MPAAFFLKALEQAGYEPALARISWKQEDIGAQLLADCVAEVRVAVAVGLCGFSGAASRPVGSL